MFTAEEKATLHRVIAQSLASTREKEAKASPGGRYSSTLLKQIDHLSTSLAKIQRMEAV